MCVPAYVLSPLGHVRLFVNRWTIALQAPLSMGFSRQEYWNGLLCPPPGNLPEPGIPMSLMSPALANGFFTTSTTWEAPGVVMVAVKSGFGKTISFGHCLSWEFLTGDQ